TNNTLSWIIHLNQENILEPRNSSNKKPDSDHELNIDLANLVYTASPPPPSVYQPLVILLLLPPPLNPPNPPANM
ncbi:15928_t:CDS:1, partial [Cetraspora pellucida]